jgi:ribosomal-protein-serine acetyltransferase
MIVCSAGADTEIRLLESRHAEELYALITRNRDHVRPWLPWADRNQTVEEVRGFIQHALGEFARGESIACAIFHQGRIVGGIGSNTDLNNSIASIGYWIGVEHQGKGLITRCVRSLSDYLFREYKLERVEIRCQQENARSRAIPVKLGFKEEGTFRRAFRTSGRSVDVVIYAMLRDEWPAV